MVLSGKALAAGIAQIDEPAASALPLTYLSIRPKPVTLRTNEETPAREMSSRGFGFQFLAHSDSPPSADQALVYRLENWKLLRAFL